MSESKPSGAMIFKILLAWAVVGIPLVWGVMQTINNAMKLFQ